MSRLAGSGSKPKGFRAKVVSKMPILQLKSVYKSLGNGFKLLFKSSQQAIGSRCGSLVQVGELGSEVLDSTIRDGFDPGCCLFGFSVHL
jgi:hypothetical protein